ncbi:hypothetical protein E2C01_062622 [Portunus trituberculatus]|uniref:Uncharacterized protein n=1 Tax=Portunus trituberculatus TaxID=210409 RepID=A0A5B7H6W1_PORTR|nr:hypothetical protein [Portunus trituberculatus]
MWDATCVNIYSTHINDCALAAGQRLEPLNIARAAATRTWPGGMIFHRSMWRPAVCLGQPSMTYCKALASESLERLLGCGNVSALPGGPI